MRNKLKKTVTAVILAIVMMWGQSFTGKVEDGEKVVRADGFVQSSESIVNPDRGFYKSLALTLTGEEDGSALFSAAYLQSVLSEVEGCSLLHLRVDLAAFSSNGKYVVGNVTRTGKTQDIPQGTLRSLKSTLEEIRKINGTAVVRFSYNQRGLEDENGYVNAEPDTTSSIPTIRKHIAQLAEVLSDYQDVISSVETGMIGPWGEQHSTTLAKIKDVMTLYYNLIEAWLDTDLDGVNFSVRRPLFYRYWANQKYNLGLTDKDMGISDEVLSAHPDLARVGVFDDAYLGSSSDMGTYTDRATETAWLNTAAETVLFGGEAVADTKTDAIGNYNRAAYAIYESRIVHTSYLNRNWNERVIGSQNGEDLSGSWETVAYESLRDELSELGVAYEPLYGEKTAYDYIADHMGYRLVLENVTLALREQTLELQITVKNVGFGNVVKAQTAQLLFTDPDGVKGYRTVDLDVRKVRSGETETYRVQCDAPSELIEGDTYGVYLKIGSAFDPTASTGTGTNLRTIAFANEEIYSAELGANKLCSFTFEEGAQIRPNVTTCERSALTGSDGQLSVETDGSGAETVRITDDGPIAAYAESRLSGHTAEAYPYILLDYESDVDFSLSVYYDTGMNCIAYRESLPKGRHTVVYRTTADMSTLRLYVAHGQSGMAETEIKFYDVRVSSHCILGKRERAGESFLFYTDGTEHYGADEILYPSGEGGTLFTPTYLSLQTTGAGLRSSGKEETSGLRFQTLIDKSDYDGLVSAFGAENVTTGTLIFPTAYLQNIDGFSVGALKSYCKKRGVSLVDIPNDGWNEALAATETYGFYGSLVRLYQENYDREFTGVGYVTVTCHGKTFTAFASFEGNSCSLRTAAQTLLADSAASGSLSAEARALIEKYAA